MVCHPEPRSATTQAKDLAFVFDVGFLLLQNPTPTTRCFGIRLSMPESSYSSRLYSYFTRCRPEQLALGEGSRTMLPDETHVPVLSRESRDWVLNSPPSS